MRQSNYHVLQVLNSAIFKSARISASPRAFFSNALFFIHMGSKREQGKQIGVAHFIQFQAISHKMRMIMIVNNSCVCLCVALNHVWRQKTMVERLNKQQPSSSVEYFDTLFGWISGRGMAFIIKYALNCQHVCTSFIWKCCLEYLLLLYITYVWFIDVQHSSQSQCDSVNDLWM